MSCVIQQYKKVMLKGSQPRERGAPPHPIVGPLLAARSRDAYVHTPAPAHLQRPHI